MSWLADLLARNSSDPRERLELGQCLVAALQVEPLPNDSTQLNDFCDLAFQWLTGSNFKVALFALETLSVGIEQNAVILMPYLIDRIPQILDRLGDSKTPVREAAADLLITMAENSGNQPQIILDRILPSLSHRVWLVRCGGMGVFTKISIFNQSQAQVHTSVSRVLPTFCALMADPNPEVRDSANDALVQLMATFGPEIVQSIQQQKMLPDKKLEVLAARCQEALKNSPVRSSRPTARSTPMRRLQPLQSDPMPLPKPPPAPGTYRTAAEDMMKTAKVEAGVVTEDDIRAAFNVTPAKLNGRFEDELEAIKTVINNINLDWSKRMVALKRLREVAILDEADGEAFSTAIKSMITGLSANVKDLRSQVMKETCITLCFLFERFGLRMLRLGEAIMPLLLTHMKNSQNVFWSCAQETALFTIQYIQAPAILSPILRESDCKAKKVREVVMVLIEKALSWPTHFLQDSLPAIEKAIKNGISDADVGTRTAAKSTFATLETYFPEKAQHLYQTLGPDGQKRVNGSFSKPQSRSNSQQSLVAIGLDPGINRRQPPMSRFASIERRGILAESNSFGRSASALDSSAISKLHSGGFRRPQPKALYPMNKTPVRNAGAVTSQPPSRSNSPTRANRMTPNRPMAPGTNLVHSGTKQNQFLSAGRQKTQEDIAHALRQVQANFGFDDSAFEDFLKPKTPPTRMVKREESGLNGIVSLIESADDMQKKRGFDRLNKLISEKAPLSPEEAKLVADSLGKAIAGGRQGIISIFCDIMTNFINVYARLLDQNAIDYWIRQLLLKSATELLPVNSEKYSKILRAINASIEPQEQLVVICKKIQDTHSGYSPKVRARMLQFLADVLRIPDATFNLTAPEVKGAVQQILQQLLDQKLSGIKLIGEEIVRRFFAISASDFAAILSQLPNPLRQLAHSLLKSETLTSNGNGNISSHSNESTSSSIRELTRQVQGLTLGRNDELTSKSTSPTASLNDDLKSDSNEFEIMDTTIDLKHDIARQKGRLGQILLAMKVMDSGRREARDAMNWLNQMLSDGSFTLWDDYFPPLLLAIFDQLKGENDVTVRMALRLLQKLCTLQQERFGPYAFTTILKVLDACHVERQAVAQTAEKCAGALAKLLPRSDVLKATITIIKEEEDPRTPAALKMLATLVNEVQANEVTSLIEELANYVLVAFQNESVTAIRKAAVTVIVNFHKKSPALMEKYINSLPSKKKRLVEVYIQREQSASTHF